MRQSNTFQSDRLVAVRGCDCPGCDAPGDYRAPRNRELSAYYFFCLPHVRDYNRNWDYLAGMSGSEIETFIRGSTVWERPTWPFGQAKQLEQHIRDKVMHEFFGEAPSTAQPTKPSLPKKAHEALSVLDLSPPVEFPAVKAQYKNLVKRFHPDANGGDNDAEEKFKCINQAFAVLKEFYAEMTA